MSSNEVSADPPEQIGGQELTHQQIVALLWRYKRALEGLTCGGSEFVNDPERCAEYVRRGRESSHSTILRLMKECNGGLP